MDSTTLYLVLYCLPSLLQMKRFLSFVISHLFNIVFALARKWYPAERPYMHLSCYMDKHMHLH